MKCRWDNDTANENNAAHIKINDNKAITSICFEYKIKLLGRTPDNIIFDAQFVVPLNYLSNFSRSLDVPLINCEIELDLLWSRYCVTFEILITPRIAGNPPPARQTTNAAFQINNA